MDHAGCPTAVYVECADAVDAANFEPEEARGACGSKRHDRLPPWPFVCHGRVRSCVPVPFLHFLLAVPLDRHETAGPGKKSVGLESCPADLYSAADTPLLTWMAGTRVMLPRGLRPLA